MKNVICALIFCGLNLSLFAQDASVEKSTFGIQTGLLGIWIHNEARLSNRVALRSELGYDAGVFGNTVYDQYGFIMVPAITLEPRWYYNINKRKNKSKRIDGNSGNFISLKSTYHPDLLVITSEKNLEFITDISIIPTWGIRRNIGSHFNFETGIGIGYVHYFNKENVVSLTEQSDVLVNLHARIGYRF
ncbi:MAG: hypothetical protein R2802_01325 [Flavobacteriaceae bacterium]